MNKFFFPVIHCQTLDQVSSDLNLCYTSWVDGVMLINMGDIGDSTFLNIIDFCKQQIKDKYFGFKLGINFLNRSNLESFLLCEEIGADYLWMDNSGTDLYNIKEITSIRDRQLMNPSPPRIFGGIHFKYQKKSKYTIEESIKRAHSLIDIPTLSGKATGKEADIEFIKRAKLAAGEKSLAIASGITEENVTEYLPYINYFLVASSIIDSVSGKFIPQKLKNLEKIIHGYDRPNLSELAKKSLKIEPLANDFYKCKEYDKYDISKK